MAETVSTTLIAVAEREVLAGGAELFSIEKLINDSMTKLEWILGAPYDTEGARSAIRAYLHEAHSLPRGGYAGPAK